MKFTIQCIPDTSFVKYIGKWIVKMHCEFHKQIKKLTVYIVKFHKIKDLTYMHMTFCESSYCEIHKQCIPDTSFMKIHRLLNCQNALWVSQQNKKTDSMHCEFHKLKKKHNCILHSLSVTIAKFTNIVYLTLHSF